MVIDVEVAGGVGEEVVEVLLPVKSWFHLMLHLSHLAAQVVS
jgi:hypothetical protein